MEKRICGDGRGIRGGMISLARFIENHRGAVERDLLCETGHELDDVGRTLSWGALSSFLSTVKMGSALGNELSPELTEWATTGKTNAILADIFDQLSMINSNLRVLITHKPGRKPEPYKRPGKENKQKYGRGALPTIGAMREWIRNRTEKR